MYIIIIGWMYVVILMAATEQNMVAGLATLLFYGILPCSILMYLMGAKSRRIKRLAPVKVESPLQSDPIVHSEADRADEKTSANR